MPQGPPSAWARLIVALIVAAVAAFAAALVDGRRGPEAVPDIWLPWRAAGSLLQGQNPWKVVEGPLMYPGTAAVVMLPFATLELREAAMAWTAVGAGALTFVAAGRGWWALTALLSWPAWLALTLPQWSPLMTAAVCVPPLAGLLIAKPTVGAALAVVRLDAAWWRQAVVGGGLLLLTSLVLSPTWPRDWWAAIHAPIGGAAGSADVRGFYFSPVRAPGGALVLLVLARWRRPEARLLAALACVPHVTMGYEYLAVLLLTPANLREAIALAVLSWPYAYLYQVWALGPTLADTFGRARFLSLAFVFLPAAVLILRRPNDGPVPRWLERRRPTV